jgi:hypothetical protein
MRLENIILNPGIQYAILAIGLSLCLFLFWSLKRDLHAAEERSRKKLAAVEEELQAKAATLDERWNELSQISNLLVPPAPLRSGLNLTKRSQAVQMIRRGESPQEIATTLALPRNEVDLLIKVQRLAQSGANSPIARAAGL